MDSEFQAEIGQHGVGDRGTLADRVTQVDRKRLKDKDTVVADIYTRLA